MQLGIIGDPKEASFKSAKERGLKFLEFCLNIGYDLDGFYKDLDDIKSYISEYDVYVGSIGRWGTDKIDKSGNIIEEELQTTYKLVDSCKELNCKTFVCGCNYVEELSYYENCTAAIAFFSKVLEYAKDKDVKIATMNCRWNNFVHSDPTWSIIHGHLKDLGIKFDPSHCIYDGGDYLSEMNKWADRFYHVHIKGSLIIDGERFDDPPAGLDQTNWGAFMAVLYAKNYDGCLSIEPHSSNWKDELGEKGIDFTIDYMNKLIF